MTDAAIAQTPAAVEQPAAAAGSKRHIPRFNCRVTTNFGDRQVRNIEILKQKSGGNESSVLRMAVDTLAYLHGLPVESDPSIYLDRFLIRSQNGDSHDR
jgi:hypothetical protein